MVSKLQEQLKLVQSEVAGKPETPKPAAPAEPAHVHEDAEDDAEAAWDAWDEEGEADAGEVEEPKNRPSLSLSEEEACGAAYWAGEEAEENEQEEGNEDGEEWDEKDDANDEDEGEENEEEEDAMDDEGEDRQLEEHEKMKNGVTHTKPVATPARAALALPNGPNLKRLASSSSLNAPTTEATVPDESAEAPTAAIVNSTTHKREYMRLDSWINTR